MDDFDGITVDRLQEAGEILGALGEAFRSISMLEEVHEEDRTRIMLMLSFTNMVVAEVALHLAKGNEIHDALRAAVRGGTKIAPEVVAMFQKALDDLNNPLKRN